MQSEKIDNVYKLKSICLSKNLMQTASVVIFDIYLMLLLLLL